jgi:hypothetical protein
MSHAILAPSAASRWLNCTPSARLEGTFPDQAGDAAREGTLAHVLSEILIKQKLGRIEEKPFSVLFEETKKSKFYSEAMLDHCENYAVFVLERFAEAQTHTKDAILHTEEKVDLSAWVPESFGTVDNKIITDSILEIIDLKYGKGVEVSAENNKQMMLYALGAFTQFQHLYDFHTVRMSIYQPRIDNYSTWEISVEALEKWAEEELKPRAALAFAGEGEYTPGNHCQFCRARAVCKANAVYQLELTAYEFRDAALLEDEEISDILRRHKAFTNWLTAVDDYALDQALNKNKKWPGFKLVEGRSNRVYSDKELAAQKLTDAGLEETLIYKKELYGITALEKNIGKKQFETIITPLLIKPPGKPALVVESDKRPAINSLETAAKEFETE